MNVILLAISAALVNNVILSQANFPELEEVENNFLEANQGLTALVLPKLRNVGKFFMHSNEALAVKLLHPFI